MPMPISCIYPLAMMHSADYPCLLGKIRKLLQRKKTSSEIKLSILTLAHWQIFQVQDYSHWLMNAPTINWVILQHLGKWKDTMAGHANRNWKRIAGLQGSLVNTTLQEICNFKCWPIWRRVILPAEDIPAGMKGLKIYYHAHQIARRKSNVQRA